MRIIPLLLYRDNNSFKGIKYKNHIYLGDILNQIRILNDYEVDELAIINIEKEFNKKSNLKLIKTLSLESDFSISVGGGITSFEYAKKIFDHGADKIILNSVVFENTSIFEKLSNQYGSQAISVKLDVVRDKNDYIIFNKNERIILSKEIKRLNTLDFAELIICDVDRDGTKRGLNKNLTKYVNEISNKLNLFSGGIKNFNEIKNLSKNKNISGLFVGAFFSLYGSLNAPLIHYLNDNQKKQIREN